MHRTFQISPVSEAASFTLEGTRTTPHPDDGSTEWAETFTCLPKLPIGATPDLNASLVITRGGDRRYNPIAMIAAFNQILDDDSKARFNALVDDRDRIIEVSDIGEIVDWLVQEVFTRPTGRSDSSSSGPPSNGHGSEAASPSPESTPTL